MPQLIIFDSKLVKIEQETFHTVLGICELIKAWYCAWISVQGTISKHWLCPSNDGRKHCTIEPLSSILQHVHGLHLLGSAGPVIPWCWESLTHSVFENWIWACMHALETGVFRPDVLSQGESSTPVPQARDSKSRESVLTFLQSVICPCGLQWTLVLQSPTHSIPRQKSPQSTCASPCWRIPPAAHWYWIGGPLQPQIDT